MNTATALYKGGSHASGNDIPVTVIDTGEKIRVEGGEFSVCKDAMENNEILEFKNKTALEILQAIHDINNCLFEQGKEHGGNHIVCKYAVLDPRKRNITGTVREIFDILQSEKQCRLSYSYLDRLMLKYDEIGGPVCGCQHKMDEGGAIGQKETPEENINRGNPSLSKMQSESKSQASDLSTIVEIQDKDSKLSELDNINWNNLLPSQFDYYVDLLGALNKSAIKGYRREPDARSFKIYDAKDKFIKNALDWLISHNLPYGMGFSVVYFPSLTIPNKTVSFHYKSGPYNSPIDKYYENADKNIKWDGVKNAFLFKNESDYSNALKIVKKYNDGVKHLSIELQDYLKPYKNDIVKIFADKRKQKKYGLNLSKEQIANNYDNLINQLHVNEDFSYAKLQDVIENIYIGNLYKYDRELRVNENIDLTKIFNDGEDGWKLRYSFIHAFTESDLAKLYDNPTPESVNNYLAGNSFADGGPILTDAQYSDKLYIEQKVRTLMQLLNYKTLVSYPGKGMISKEDALINDIATMIYFGKEFHSKADPERLAKQKYDFTDKQKVKELTEYAILIVGREIAQKYPVPEAYERIVALYNVQPYSTHRTSLSQQLQQFSTPIPMAYLMGVFCGDGANYKILLEPTAGNGFLTISGSPENFIVNEIDRNRFNNLQKDNYKLKLNQDALKPFPIPLNSVDGVIANPPFGAPHDGYVVDRFHITGLEQKIIVNALNYVKDDSKSAFIIGEWTEFTDKGTLKTFRDKNFFGYLWHSFNVVDVIQVSGDLYGKQGTVYPIRIILLGGRKTTKGGFYPLRDNNKDVLSEFSPHPVMNFEDLYKRFKIHW